MSSADLIAWIATQVNSLLPGLEGEYLTEAVKYSLTLPPQDTDRHWRSLLGSSPQVDTFLKQLKDKRTPKPSPQTHLHTPIPLSSSASRGLSSSETSRTPSPSKVLRITSKPAQRKKGPGKLTSDLGKPKPKPPQEIPIAKAVSENRPLTELEEIDSALQAITITPKKRAECGCFGTKHDIYPLAPNCLTCGRIICIVEGIGPCFHCGEALIDETQREELVRELRHERGQAKTKAANEKVKKVRVENPRNRVWASKVSGHESSDNISGRSTPAAYVEAERRRDELLEFDRTFAERTKIIDQQAEFMPHATMFDGFSTPQERAAALRRLQQVEAEQVAAERARSRRVLEINFERGRGNVRSARAEDFVDVPVSSEMVAEERPERGVGMPVEIVNGFAKPTFLES